MLPPLSPLDTPLSWESVQQCAEDQFPLALEILRGCGIILPDDAIQNIVLDSVDYILLKTAEALGVPLQDVWAARNDVRWTVSIDDYSVTRVTSEMGGVSAEIQNAPVLAAMWPVVR